MNTRAPYQYFFYTPFGETILQEDAFNASYDNPWRFNGKELDPETGNYYYGARYYNPKWSVWLGVDPLAHKYPSMSPFVFTGNNPIMLVDPDGRWIPKLDENGNVSYIAEKGDSYSSFKKQYGLTDKEASTLLNPEAKIQEGITTVTGTQAKSATGSEILKLDVSNEDLTPDDLNHQFAFAISYEVANNNTQKDNEGNFKDYFKGLYEEMSRTAGGTFDGINTYRYKPTEVDYCGLSVKINFDLRGLHDGRFEAERGDEFTLNSNKIRYGLRIYHPNRTDKKNIEIAKIWIHY